MEIGSLLRNKTSWTKRNENFPFVQTFNKIKPRDLTINRFTFLPDTEFLFLWN